MGYVFSALLNKEMFEFLECSISSEPSSSISQERKSWFQWGLRMGMYAAGAMAVWANFGFGIMSFSGGESFINNEAFGILSVIFRLVASLGFSKEGVSEFGDFSLNGSSLEGREMSILYFSLMALGLLVAFPSRVTADQMGYEGWKNGFTHSGESKRQLHRESLITFRRRLFIIDQSV